MRALEIQRTVIVESDPDHAQQLGRESGKPAVARRAGFTRGGNIEAARAYGGGGSGAQYFFQHVDHQIGHARIEHLAGLRLVLIDHRAVLRTHRGNPVGLDINALVGENRVRSGDFERCGVISAQRHGGSGCDVFVQAGFLGELHHRVVAHHLGDLDGRDVHGVS